MAEAASSPFTRLLGQITIAVLGSLRATSAVTAAGGPADAGAASPTQQMSGLHDVIIVMTGLVPDSAAIVFLALRR